MVERVSFMVYDKDLLRKPMTLDEACGLSRDPIILTDTSEVEGDWGAMIILEDNTVFNILETEVKKNDRYTYMQTADWNDMGGWFKGDVIYGRIKKVKLTSGKVQLV